MLTKNRIKFARSLRSKKERYSHSCFIIEGEKIVAEALNSQIDIDEVIGLDYSQGGDLVKHKKIR